MKCGIIPAGGKATRWGGFPKEFLPTGNSWTLLEKMFLLQQRALVDRIYLVSSQEKEPLHRWWLESRGWPNISILLADSVKDAILVALTANGPADYIFSMPDTWTDIPLFPETLDKPLMLGIFSTNQSERFGMLRDDVIVDKQQGEPGMAWGAFMFNEDVAKMWLRKQNSYTDHTEMLNAALSEFDWGTWQINTYRDIASYYDYLRLLEEIYAEK